MWSAAFSPSQSLSQYFLAQLLASPTPTFSNQMPVQETGPVWDVYPDDHETDVLQEEEVEVVQEAVAHGTVVVHEADVEQGTDIQSYSGGLREVRDIDPKHYSMLDIFEE